MNRRDRRRAEAQQRAQRPQPGLFCIPPDASPLLKHLVPRILRASLDGTGKGGDLELEERAMACLTVLVSHLAGIADDELRNGTIDALSEIAALQVSRTRQIMSEQSSAATARGMSLQEAFEEAAKAGVAEPLPDEPSEH